VHALFNTTNSFSSGNGARRVLEAVARRFARPF
jgi:hypothetical protein